jgi:hypothetical protein
MPGWCALALPPVPQRRHRADRRQHQAKGQTVSRRCRACGRKLRDPLARARGVGPTCARRLGLTPSRRCTTVLVPTTRTVPAGDVLGQLALFDLELVGGHR